MIIVDHNSESSLQHTLESLRSSGVSMRCIRVRTRSSPSLLKPFIFALVQQSDTLSSSQEKHLYVCDDGDVFLLSHGTVAKELEAITHWLLTQPHLALQNAQILLYELPQQLGALTVLVEEKLERKRLEQEAKKKEDSEKRVHQKRDAILSAPVDEHTQERIRALRAKHTMPEIMFIEDDTFSRRLIESTLKKEGNLTLLPDAMTAIPSYIGKAPHIVFLDINLPDISGLELLQKFVAIDADAYVVMFSGNSQKDNIVTAIQHGAKGFVGKPFTRDKLLHYIHACPTLPKSLSS